MCRLYGFRSNEPTKVECSLVYAQNALLSQSIVDARGEPNADGWGIGYYEGSALRVARRNTAAHHGEHFSLAAERVYSETVVAHVRQATIGGHSLTNTHPFSYGSWTFAHNGTLHGFEQLRERMEEETAADLRSRRKGDTDSEAAFLWLMTRMRAGAGGQEIPVLGADALADIVATSVRLLDERSRAVSPERPPRLNFLVTDGHALVATRLRNSLSWIERAGIHDCEICGIPHVHHTERHKYRAVAVASEPISDEAWQELPDASLLRVSPDLAPLVRPL